MWHLHTHSWFVICIFHEEWCVICLPKRSLCIACTILTMQLLIQAMASWPRGGAVAHFKFWAVRRKLSENLLVGKFWSKMQKLGLKTSFGVTLEFWEPVIFSVWNLQLYVRILAEICSVCWKIATSYPQCPAYRECNPDTQNPGKPSRSQTRKPMCESEQKPGFNFGCQSVSLCSTKLQTIVFTCTFLSWMWSCKLEGLALWYELSSICLSVCL